VRTLNDFEECIRRKQLRKETPSPEKAEKSISESREWLNEAKKSNKSGARRAAFISIYLSYFHSARAVLFNDGFREKSHYCIGVYLQKLADEKKMDAKWPVIFHSIRNQRHTQQYSFQTERSEKEILQMVYDSEEFIEGMERYLKDILNGEEDEESVDKD
jgi:uncharacterized protein (UPF0332 family)